MSKLRVFEAFAGYGSQSISLRNIGVDYEVVAISEIDKYAIQAYEAIHGPTLNLGDISKIKVEDIPQHDLFTYSFPCQDLSVAGKQAGLIRGQTRSGLLYECEKIIEYCKPKYLLMENVKNLVGKKFRPQFYEWLRYLKSLGYTNYTQVLNAKDYGVPQNRERVFVVSILGDHKPYKFPEPIKLDKCIADILEDKVDEKYYPGSCGFTIRSKMPDQKILEKVERTPLKFLNRNGKQTGSDYTFCVDTCHTGGIKEIYNDNTYRIRKLTPRECFRLMGLKEDDIDKIQQAGISNTQQYKMAGNSIVIDVLEAMY